MIALSNSDYIEFSWTLWEVAEKVEQGNSEGLR